MKIYPSILENSAALVYERLKTLSPFFSYFQIDSADGIFVNNTTAQTGDLLTYFQDKPLNFLQGKHVEFHLMTTDWQSDVQNIEKMISLLDISRVFLHIQTIKDSHPIEFPHFEVGLSLNPEDRISDSWEYIKQYDSVQLMTVNPGKQRNPFLPAVLDKIDELRVRGFHGEIILDGGINDKTLPLIVSRKNVPDAVCPGSYLLNEIENHLKKLQEIMNVL